MPEEIKLSESIAALQRTFHRMLDASPKADITITMTGEDARRLREAFAIMHDLALNMEIELACHRDMEAGRELHKAIEKLSQDHLADMLAETESKVIRPDFKGRKR